MNTQEIIDRLRGLNEMTSQALIAVRARCKIPEQPKQEPEKAATVRKLNGESGIGEAKKPRVLPAKHEPKKKPATDKRQGKRPWADKRQGKKPAANERQTEAIRQLAEKLGVPMNNPDLWLEAVTHRSYLNEHPRFRLGHNERLEFLGDAVLELIVTRHLFENYPNQEGDLTNWRASLVNGNMLGKLARELGIEDFLLLSRGESGNIDSKARSFILANAFEAIVGAIYLDAGLERTDAFIKKHLIAKLPEILEKKLHLDPKSRFQEVAQKKYTITPAYKVLKETGPEHAKKFTVGVYIGEEEIAQGRGSSKQEAQVDAARAGLEAKGWE